MWYPHECAPCLHSQTCQMLSCASAAQETFSFLSLENEFENSFYREYHQSRSSVIPEWDGIERFVSGNGEEQGGKISSGWGGVNQRAVWWSFWVKIYENGRYGSLGKNLLAGGSQVSKGKEEGRWKASMFHVLADAWGRLWTKMEESEDS